MTPRENEYSRQVRRMTDEGLEDVITNYTTYREELVQAVLWEVENRSLNIEVSDQINNYIRTYFEAKEAEQAELKRLQEEAAKNLQEPSSYAESAPALYSQSAILGFSLFFSPISAGILLSLNIKRLKKKGIVQVMIFAVVFTIFQGYVSMKMSQGSLINLLVNVAGALIMSELLWKQFIGARRPVNRRSILIPLLICIAIVAPLAWYVYQNPEILEVAKP